jgi:hypothetical protein
MKTATLHFFIGIAERTLFLVPKEKYPYPHERIIFYFILRNTRQLQVKSKKVKGTCRKPEIDLNMLCKNNEL